MEYSEFKLTPDWQENQVGLCPLMFPPGENDGYEGRFDTQAKVRREYLLRGGFLMADDFQGEVVYAMTHQALGVTNRTPTSCSGTL